jgi:hypothetical protein
MRESRTWSSSVASRQSEVFPYPEMADAVNSAASAAATAAMAVNSVFAPRLVRALNSPTVSTAVMAPNTTSMVGRTLLEVQVK